jgi:hypothetical protein
LYQRKWRLRHFLSNRLFQSVLILVSLFKPIAKVAEVIVFSSLGTFLKVVKVIPKAYFGNFIINS